MTKEEIINEIVDEARKSNDLWRLDPEILLEKYLNQALAEQEKEHKKIWREYERKIGRLKDTILQQKEKEGLMEDD